MLKKAASGVLAILPCSRTMSTLRASKWLRPCWIDPSERLRACFFEHSLPLMMRGSFGAFIGCWSAIFNRPCVKNPKLEYRNPRQIQMFKFQMTTMLGAGPCDLLHGHDPFETFGFWISDLFRISRFGFRVYSRYKPTTPFNPSPSRFPSPHSS